MDYQKLVDTCTENERPDDDLENSLQQIFEDGLKQAALKGSCTAQFKMSNLLKQFKDYNYTDLYFEIDKVVSMMADEAIEQHVDLSMQKLTSDIFCLHYLDQ